MSLKPYTFIGISYWLLRSTKFIIEENFPRFFGANVTTNEDFWPGDNICWLGLIKKWGTFIILYNFYYSEIIINNFYDLILF